MGVFVRSAEPLDIGWIVPELKKFSEFYGSDRSLYPGDAKAILSLHVLMDKHVFLVSERDGVPTGFIAGLLTPHFFNESIMVLTEVLWWVIEEFRGTRSGYLLLQEFTKTGKKIADWTIMTTECKSNIGDSSILSMGYRQYEKSFLLEV